MSEPTTFEIDFSTLDAPRARLGESPVWDAAGDCVWWVDVEGLRLFRTRLDSGETESWKTPEMPGFVVLTDRGAPALGMESGIFLLDPARGAFERIVALEDPRVHFNDAAVDPAGRLWAGTMERAIAAPLGAVHAVGSDLRLTLCFDGFWTINGLAVDAERNRLYLSDSHPTRQEIWTAPLDPETGAPGAREAFASLRPLRGRPDGAAIDRDGRYWIAGVGGGVIHVFDPDGSPVAEIETPVENPTKLCFGGAARETLFLTAKDGAIAIGRPRGGAIFGRVEAAWRLDG